MTIISSQESGVMKSGYIVIILAIAGCIGIEAFGQGINPVSWNVSLTSYGSNVYYNPTSSILDNSYRVYDYHVEITKVEVKILFGWIDVTQTVGGPFVSSGQDTDGLPTVVLSNTYGSSSYNVSADVLIWASEDGYGHATISNVSLGITQGIRASGTVTLQGISKPYLTTHLVGGEGTISPASGEQPFKRVVDLIVTPEYGYRILRWEGSDNDTLKTRNGTVTMNGNRTVTAVLEPYIPGDLSDDGTVDMEDFALFGQQWIRGGCADPDWCNGADVSQDGAVLTADAIMLAENWLFWDDTQGTAGYWPLDELAGNAASDSSGNLRNGTLINGPVWNASGTLNGALQFDGVNDYVSVAEYKGILGTSSRTCAAWIKTPGTAQNMVILGWGGQQWVFGLFGSGELTVYAGGPYIKTALLVNDDQWHHVAAVMTDDGSPNVSEITLYVDGILQTTVNAPGVINTPQANDVLIGAFSAGTPAGFFKGLLDDVRLYNMALSGAQIEQIFQVAGTD